MVNPNKFNSEVQDSSSPISPPTPEAQTVTKSRVGGHDYGKTASNGPLDKTQAKTDEARKSWKNTLSSIASAPFHGLAFIAKKMGENLNKAASTIQDLANEIFFGIYAIVKKAQPQKSEMGKQTVQEHILLEEIAKKFDSLPLNDVTKISILHQFDRDMVGSDYYLNNTLLLKENERSEQDKRFEIDRTLIEKFGEEGFENISHILIQTMVENLQATVQKLIGIEKGSRNISAARYYIQEGDPVRLTVQTDFQIIDLNNPDLDHKDPNTGVEGYISVRRDIIIPLAELKTKWSSTPKEKILPNTIVEDRFSEIHSDIRKSQAQIKRT